MKIKVVDDNIEKDKELVSISRGLEDAGNIVALNGLGKIDNSMIEFPPPTSPRGTIILLHADETDGTEFSNTADENILKGWILPANNYARIIVEGEIRYRMPNLIQATTHTVTVRIREGGIGGIIRKTFLSGVWSSVTTVVPQHFIFSPKTSLAGGQGSPTSLVITGQLGLAHSDFTIMGCSMRVYGVV
ncbi:MAG: hypothetical protein DDT23_00023 [candidate division WS2 bacterium]|nr:hypothetical protein [Candidatus Lithacetigena glycinireducens]